MIVSTTLLFSAVFLNGISIAGAFVPASNGQSAGVRYDVVCVVALTYLGAAASRYLGW